MNMEDDSEAEHEKRTARISEILENAESEGYEGRYRISMRNVATDQSYSWFGPDDTFFSEQDVRELLELLQANNFQCNYNYVIIPELPEQTEALILQN